MNNEGSKKMASQEAIDALFAYMRFQKAKESGNAEEIERYRSEYLEAAYEAFGKDNTKNAENTENAETL